MSRFIDSEQNGLSKPEYYFVSQDVIHQLRKILIPDFEKDYQTSSADLNYVKTDDSNPGNVNEIPLFIPRERKVFPCVDGCIVFNCVWDGSDADSFLRGIKYDEQGNVLWTQNYTDIKLERDGYRFSDCIQTEDGGFAFIVNGSLRFLSTESWVPGDEEEAVITSGWLVKCDKDGNIVWKEQLEFVGSSGDTRIFETADGNILTAETCQTDDGEHYKTGDSAYGYTDLLFRKYDKTGERIATKKYGESDFDSFQDACYSPGIGWVVWGRTQSTWEFLAVFDDDLNEKWQYVFTGQNEIYTTYSVTVGEQIYVTGSLSGNTGKHSQTAVFKFDDDGTVAKSKIIDAATVMGICATTDDAILVSVHPFAYNGSFDTPQICRLDAELNIESTTYDAANNGFDYKVVPAGDNGFYTVQTQHMKYLPQPPWMSRLMIDSATVLSRYDAAGTLLYRKTYDKNHEVEDIDTVIPLSDGRVIIDR